MADFDDILNAIDDLGNKVDELDAKVDELQANLEVALEKLDNLNLPGGDYQVLEFES